MLGGLALLAACGLVVPLNPPGEAKDGKAEAVKEIDLKGLRRDFPKGGDVKKPTVIAGAKELAKAFPEEDWQARIKKEVDFSQQQLLLFAWSGSGMDALEIKVEDGKKGPVVTFRYQVGASDDNRAHFRLYAIPKEATWKVVDR